MKKNWFYLTLMILMLAFVACSEEKEYVEPQLEVTPHNIAGEWMLKSFGDGQSVAEGCYLYDTRSSIVQLPKDKIAVISGLKEYIVVDTEDVLMICPRSEEQSIKKFIDEVKFHNGEKHI